MIGENRVVTKPPHGTQRLPISAFLICKDEQDYITACIQSLSRCAEIVVVDSGSTDGTLPLLQSFAQNGWPIRVIHNDWPGYARQKQFALDQCTQEWCLNIDADERLEMSLQDALQDMIACESVAGWRFSRRPYLIGFGYTPRGVEERANLRLIRRGRGHYDTTQRVHEGIVLQDRIKVFQEGSLLHYRPLLMDEQILKENRYSSLKADQFVAEYKQARVLKLVFSPIIYFLRLYLWNGLWRCGAPGFIQAMTGAIYAFLTQAKIHQRYAVRRKPNVDDWRQQTAVAPVP